MIVVVVRVVPIFQNIFCGVHYGFYTNFVYVKHPSVFSVFNLLIIVDDVLNIVFSLTCFVDGFYIIDITYIILDLFTVKEVDAVRTVVSNSLVLSVGVF
jgi:hypothetical protein